MSGGRLRIFAYVTEPNARLYRAVLGGFMAAKERFRLHLRPAEVLQALREAMSADESALGSWEQSGDPSAPTAPDLATVEAALRQLSAPEWGNLESHPDTALVATVEEFYRPRFLYRLTQRGAAAEQALALFDSLSAQRGALQTAALGDIRGLLEELASLCAAAEPDAGKLYLTLEALYSRFAQLTEQAQTFLSSLQRAIDLHGASLAAFVAYKERLIDYLERFINELLLSRLEIAQQVTRIEASGIEQALLLAAERQLTDALEPTAAERSAVHATWQRRWAGLREWFVGESGMRSQAEELRRHALAAIPALLSALAGLHDRRTRKVDRSADLRTLARWFATAPTQADAHRLWRAAFGLHAARHLRIDPATLAARDQDPVAASTSFRDAPPIRIAPRLRTHGQTVRPGRAMTILDRSEDKALLRASAEAETAQLLAAQKRLGRGERLRLSQLGRLDATEFGLLLELLGEALATREPDGRYVQTVSSDGLLNVHLEPTADGAEAAIETALGTLRGPDHFITISSALGTWEAA
jgi:uncharacterized protein (TIGR02677 family)